MSDWADEKARELAGGHYYCEDSWYSCPAHPEGCADDSALSKCRCGHDERAGKVAGALREDYERGQQEERWSCHEAVREALEQIPDEAALLDALNAIAARGPMRKPEEE